MSCKELETASSRLNVTTNLRGRPQKKTQIVRALFSRKPPQTTYQEKSYKIKIR